MLSFWATFGFTLLMSYVLYAIIEAPLEGLERMIFPNRRSSPAPKKESRTEIEPKKDNEAQLDQANPECASTKATKDLES